MKRIIGIAAALGIAIAVSAGTTHEATARGGGGGHGGGHNHSSTSKCVGVCYGVTSAKTGLPRNTYIHGYVKKDGTVVQSYTRSQ